MYSYIHVMGKKYYFQGTYAKWELARQEGKRKNKRNKKCKYFITKTKEGMYKLWLTHAMTMY